MKQLFITIFFIFVISAPAANKTIPQLINDLGVKDRGSHTCNTAAGILVQKYDESVPYLEKALSNPNKQIRESAIRCLCDINSKKSRKILIDIFPNVSNEMCSVLAYYLAWHPTKDAEEIYIASLNDKTPHHLYRFIYALGKIKSVKALPNLKAIISTPKGWRLYYTAFCAVREIENKNLTKELADAIVFMRNAQYSYFNVNKEQLSRSVALIKKNIISVLPDIFNAYLFVTKGNRLDRDPSVATLLADAGKDAYPYILIGLNDPDNNIKRKTESLLKKLEISKKLVENGSFFDNLFNSIF